jgi:hypothetical protein
LDLVGISLLEHGREADQHQRGGVFLRPRQCARPGKLLILQHRADMPYEVPTGRARPVEGSKARNDDAIGCKPGLLKRRQGAKAGLLAHADEHPRNPVPHIELSKYEAVAEHDGGTSVVGHTRKRCGKHRVNADQIRALLRNDGRDLLFDCRRGQIAGGLCERQTLRIAIDLCIGVGDLDRPKTRCPHPRHLSGRPAKAT